MRAFAEAWQDAEFVQLAAAQLPWGHNLVLLTGKDKQAVPVVLTLDDTQYQKAAYF